MSSARADGEPGSFPSGEGHGHPLDVIMRSAMRGARGDLALVALRVDDQRLIIHAGTGPLAQEMVGNLMLVRDSVAAPVLTDGTPLLVPDYAREGGAAPEVRVQIGSVIIAPLHSGDRIDGALAVGRLSGAPSFEAAELDQLTAFVERVGVARELVGAHEERRTARLIEDRNRIRDDLHDHVIQELFAAGMALQSTGKLIQDAGHRALVLAQVEALDLTTRRIRGLISNIPIADEDAAALPLVKRLVAIVDSMTPALNCLPTVTFVGPVESRTPPEVAADMEAVLREALSNVARHALASSVQVKVWAGADALTLDVRDNGRGIQRTSRMSGLANMRRRATRHDGRMDIDRPPGGGTQLRWSVPLKAE